MANFNDSLTFQNEISVYMPSIINFLSTYILISPALLYLFLYVFTSAFGKQTPSFFSYLSIIFYDFYVSYWNRIFTSLLLINFSSSTSEELQPIYIYNLIQMHQTDQPKGTQPKHNQMQMRNAHSEEAGSLSSNTMRHKMPEIILNYIIQKAKLKHSQHQHPKANKYSRAAARMTLSKRLSGKFHREKCPICESQVPAHQLTSISSCNHLFCNSCLHQYIIYKIGVFENVQCPNENCHQTIDQKSLIYSQLPLQARKKYKKIKQYNDSLKNPNRKLCPNEHCDGFLELPESKQNQIRIANPKCNSCSKIYCSKCFFEEHEGDCDPYQLNFFQDTLHYRQCAKCKNVIERSQGCNHMTCRCGYQFCYVCGAKWKHSHQCNNPDGQPIYNNPEFECCECCDECCETCGDNFEQCCCEGCCQPCCEGLGSCCQVLCCGCQCCQQCDCQCCENPCCSMIGKILFFVVWITFIVPFYYLWFFLVIFLQILGGIFFGIFTLPCVLCAQQQIECCHIIIGLIFLPFTILFLMGLGIKTLLCSQEQEIGQMACVPCTIFSECMES